MRAYIFHFNGKQGFFNLCPFAHNNFTIKTANICCQSAQRIVALMMLSKKSFAMPKFISIFSCYLIKDFYILVFYIYDQL